MKAVIDANVLMQLLGVISNGLVCPQSGQPIDKLDLRAEALLAKFSQPHFDLLIPAPVLAEVLVKIEPEKHQEYTDAINGMTCLSIVNFDQKSAIECAKLFDSQEVKQLKREGETKAKIAVDRQVIAIAVANGAGELWTHDKKMCRKAKKTGIDVMSFADIDPLPIQEAMEFIEATI